MLSGRHSLHREAEQAHSLSATSPGKPKQGQGCLARPEFWQCAAWTTEMFHGSSDNLGSTSFNSVTLICWFKLMMVLFIISCDPAVLSGHLGDLVSFLLQDGEDHWLALGSQASVEG